MISRYRSLVVFYTSSNVVILLEIILAVSNLIV